MNIVKFTEAKLDSAKYSFADTYNTYFRGRYCWCINMTDCYLIRPDKDSDINGILPDDYNSYERGTGDTTGLTTLEYGDIPSTSVDFNKSLIKISTEYFTDKNAYIDAAVDADIDTERVKAYRRYVALYILNGIHDGWLTDFCDKRKALLNYYANDMSDDTLALLKGLDEVNTNTTATTSSCGCSTASTSSGTVLTTSSCGCSNGNGLSSIDVLINKIQTCSLADDYASKMKYYMTETFTDLDFWKYIYEHYNTAIGRIATLTDLLIKSGLSINIKTGAFDLNYTCATASKTDAVYKQFVSDLQIIADAFHLMENGDFTKTATLSNALSTLASYYEYLQWV